MSLGPPVKLSFDEREKILSALPQDGAVTFADIVSKMEIRTHVENVIYRLNIPFSELKTIIAANKGLLECFRKRARSFRIGPDLAHSTEHLAKLREDIATEIDVIALSEKFDKVKEISKELMRSEDVSTELKERLVEERKLMVEWVEEIRDGGPAICEELLSLAEIVEQTKKLYSYEMECLHRKLTAQMFTILVAFFQNMRVQLLHKHREIIGREHAEAYRRQEEICLDWLQRQREGDATCQELANELHGLALHRKRLPKQNERELEISSRLLKSQRKKISELEKKLKTLKHTSDAVKKASIRKEEEYKKERSDLCIEVALRKATLCKSLKKAHLAGAKVEDLMKNDEDVCIDNILLT